MSGRIATPMLGSGFVGGIGGGGGMSGRIATPVIPVAGWQMGASGGGPAVGQWEQRQRTTMYRTGSSNGYPATGTVQRMGSGLTSSHGRSRLDCVGEGDSAQASPASTPPLDVAARKRQQSGLGTGDMLPLWLRSESNSSGGSIGSGVGGGSCDSKPLWLRHDGDPRVSPGNAQHSQWENSHGSNMKPHTNTSTDSSLISRSSSYQPSMYQPAQRLNSQSHGRRGTGGILDMRPTTGQRDDGGGGLFC